MNEYNESALRENLIIRKEVKTNTVEESYKIDRRTWLFLSIIIGVGASIRFYHIGWLSFWVDEGFSEWTIQHDFWYLWHVLPKFETTPPLYYILLKLWRLLFGDSEAALRSLSALVSTATIPILFVTGRMLDEKIGCRIGLIASLLFSLSPVQVQYAQEARTYALFVFFVGVSMFAAIRLMRPGYRGDGINRNFDMEDSGITFYGLGISLALIFWFHFTGVLAIVAITIPLVYWWVKDINYNRKVFVKLLTMGFISVLIALPNFFYFLQNTKNIQKSFWVQKPNLMSVAKTISDLFGTQTENSSSIVLVLIALAVFGIRELWYRGFRSVTILLVFVGIFPIISELVVSCFTTPIFLERTLLYVSLPLYILVGYGLSQIGYKYGTPIVIAFIFFFLISVGSFFGSFEKEPWAEIAGYMSSSLDTDQPVFYAPSYSGVSLEYYMHKKHTKLAAIGVPSDWPDPTLISNEQNKIPILRSIEKSDVDKMVVAAQKYSRVGVILRLQKISDPQNYILTKMSREFDLVCLKEFPGKISVMIFSKKTVK